MREWKHTWLWWGFIPSFPTKGQPEKQCGVFVHVFFSIAGGLKPDISQKVHQDDNETIANLSRIPVSWLRKQKPRNMPTEDIQQESLRVLKKNKLSHIFVWTPKNMGSILGMTFFFSHIKRDFQNCLVAQFGAPIRGGMSVLWGKKGWRVVDHVEICRKPTRAYSRIPMDFHISCLVWGCSKLQ